MMPKAEEIYVWLKLSSVKKSTDEPRRDTFAQDAFFEDQASGIDCYYRTQADKPNSEYIRFFSTPDKALEFLKHEAHLSAVFTLVLLSSNIEKKGDHVSIRAGTDIQPSNIKAVTFWTRRLDPQEGEKEVFQNKQYPMPSNAIR